MSTSVVSDSVLKEILITLYWRVLEKQGGKVVELKRTKFHAFDRQMEQDVPAVVNRNVKPIKVEYASYILRMESLNYIERNEMEFHFTDEGFLYASELAQPIRAFFKKNWQFIVGTCIALCALTVAILKLL